MPDPDTVVDLFSGGHFVVAFLVGLAASMAAPRYVHLALAGALAIGGLDWSAAALVPAIAAAVAGSLLREDGSRAAGEGTWPVVVAVVAAGALYACVPDTERARALVGAIAASAIVVVALRGRWRRLVVATAVAVAGIALFDGVPRSSSQLAGIGIALVLVAGRFGPGPKVVLRAVVGVAAFALLSRGVGLSEDTDWPALAAVGVTGVAVASNRALGADPDEDPAQLLAS